LKICGLTWNFTIAGKIKWFYLAFEKSLEIQSKAQSINPKETTCKSNYTMKKGKRSTLIVLAVEILTIAVLHAVKINQSEKGTSVREVSKNVASQPENQPDSKSDAIFSVASYR